MAKFILTKGADFNRLVEIFDSTSSSVGMDLTGYNIKSQIRRTPNESEAAAEFTIEEVDLSVGKFRLKLEEDITAAIPVRIYWFDIMFESPSGVFTFSSKEQVEVRGSITKPNS